MSRARATAARDRVRQDPDAGAPTAHRPDDVRLEPEVDDPDERAVLIVATDVHDRRRRDLADEVLVLPAGNRSRPIDGVGAVHEVGLRDDRAQAAVGPQVAGQGAGVDPGDGRDAVVAQERRELAGVVEHGRGRVGHDQRTQPRVGRLVVVDEATVVADEGVRHDHDLARVRGVGADLLVAGLARVDDEVATSGDRGPERDPGEYRPVLERQQRRTQIADARVDDRGGSRRRGHDHATATSTGPGARRATNDPPAAGAWWARACANIRASFAGLTGPVRQPHRTGHERTPSG